MAANGYFGKPGSGKSYSVVEYVIIPALKKGRHVVTNIPLEVDLLTQVYGGRVTQLPLDVLDVEDLAALLPHGCVAVIDEVWRRWPSGQKVNRVSQADLQLLKEHRHRVDAEGNAMQVVLVSQDPGDLASWLRKLIAHSFHMEKLDSVGLDSKFSIRVYKGCPVGERIPAKLLLRDAHGTYRPEVYQYYRSATQSQASDLNVGDEKAMDRRATVWGSWQIKATLLFVPLAIAGGLYLFWYWLGMADRQAERQAAITGRPAPSVVAPAALVNPDPLSLPVVAAAPVAAAPAASAHAPAAPAAPAAPLLSQQWRIKGYIKRGEPGGSKVAWQSLTGYGYQPAVESQEKWLEDLVVVQGLGVVRYVPVSECTAYPNSPDYYCDLDGERVTPWSGQMGYSAEVVGAGAATGATNAAPKAVEKAI